MYIILGSGTAGHYAGSHFKEAGYQVTLVDINRERMEALREMGFQNVSRVNRIRLG